MSQSGAYASGGGGGGINLLSFLAVQTVTSSDVTGDGTVFILGSDTPLTVINDTAHVITGGMTFTAPATGTYYLGVSVLTQWDEGGGFSPLIYQLQIITTAATYINQNVSGGAASTSSSVTIANLGLTFGIVAPMSVTDTATFAVMCNNDGDPSKVVSVLGNTNASTSFFGFRIN